MEFDNIQFMSYSRLMKNEDSIETLHPDYIILDEFHRCGAAEWGKSVRKLLTACPDAKRLGLSATNIRYLDNQRNMAEEIFDGKIASEMTLGEAIVRGILPEPKYVIAMYSYKKELDQLKKRIQALSNQGLITENQKLLEQLRRALEQAEGLDIVFEKHMEKKNGKTMKGLPISERPYEKVLEKGPVSLSDAELLSVILRSGTKNIPVRDMAEEILNAGNPPGLAGLLHGTVEDYKEIRGVGEVKAIQLACIGELSARIWKAAASEKTIVFDAPSKVAAFYMEEMRHLEQENLKLLLLNTKNILLRDITVSRGTVNASCATPREIYIEALRFRACGIILLHNHPSGDPAPSREDCLFTERVREAGSLMGVPLLDHIIIGDNSYVSLRERGIFET